MDEINENQPVVEVEDTTTEVQEPVAENPSNEECTCSAGSSNDKCKCKCKCCKCIPYILLGILSLAVIFLYLYQFEPQWFCCASSGNADTTNIADPQVDAEELLPIAYVDLDTLLTQCTLYTTKLEELQKEGASIESSYRSEMAAFQQEVMKHQEKLQYNAYATAERAQQEDDRLVRKQQQLEQKYAGKQKEILLKQEEVNSLVYQKIRDAVKEYNADKKYHLIFSNMGMSSILYGNQAYNITEDIVAIINK